MGVKRTSYHDHNYTHQVRLPIVAVSWVHRVIRDVGISSSQLEHIDLGVPTQQNNIVASQVGRRKTKIQQRTLFQTLPLETNEIPLTISSAKTNFIHNLFLYMDSLVQHQPHNLGPRHFREQLLYRFPDREECRSEPIEQSNKNVLQVSEGSEILGKFQ